jgi:hypothetical protein
MRFVCGDERILIVSYENDHGQVIPLCLTKQTSTVATATSVSCRGCCKSRKSNDPENFAKVDFWTSLLLHRFSTPLLRSVIDFG